MFPAAGPLLVHRWHGIGRDTETRCQGRGIECTCRFEERLTDKVGVGSYHRFGRCPPMFPCGNCLGHPDQGSLAVLLGDSGGNSRGPKGCPRRRGPSNELADRHLAEAAWTLLQGPRGERASPLSILSLPGRSCAVYGRRLVPSIQAASQSNRVSRDWYPISTIKAFPGVCTEVTDQTQSADRPTNLFFSA